MTTAGKRRGSQFETDLLNHIRAWANMAGNGWRVRREARAGSKDQGDLSIDLGHTVLVLEAKAEKRIDLAGYMKEAEVEADNWSAAESRGDVFGIAVVKRRQKPILDAYAVLPLHQLLHLLNRE